MKMCRNKIQVRLSTFFMLVVSLPLVLVWNIFAAAYTNGSAQEYVVNQLWTRMSSNLTNFGDMGAFPMGYDLSSPQGHALGRPLGSARSVLIEFIIY